MSDFHVRSDSVDVEQIMEQIRRRVRDKRGVDYTEEQIRELAGVRLEKFLDPKNLRSDLLEQFRKSRPPEDSTLPPIDAPYEFEDSTLYDTHRGVLRTIRRLLNPILKLFFNPNTIVHALHQQADLNKHFARTMGQARIDRAAWNSLYYEVLHNLVLETTRSGIESEEPQDARGGAVEPPRLLGAPLARARGRRAIPSRGRGAARATRRRAAHRAAAWNPRRRARRQFGDRRGRRCRGCGHGDARRRRRRRRGRRGPGPGGSRRRRRRWRAGDGGADVRVERGRR